MILMPLPDWAKSSVTKNHGMEPGPKVVIVDVVDGLRDDDDSHGDGEDVNLTFCHSKNVDHDENDV